MDDKTATETNRVRRIVIRWGQQMPRTSPSFERAPSTGRLSTEAGTGNGHSISWASRITAEAEAGRLVATQELRDATTDVCSWASLGTRQVKGVEDEVELFQAERPVKR